MSITKILYRKPSRPPALPADSLRVRADAAEIAFGSDVQRRAVVAPGAITGFLARVDAPQMTGVRGKDVDAPRARRKKVSLPVNLHPIGQAGKFIHGRS